ncbi:hypothetical protein V1508DRAFT_378648 [Lipomyces doorenjongii]|uniref:uncharacterized protein n=1 Tax=Lipomyces doorenjongii TaxID=383834 RepID=UPI0034CFFA99
MSASPSPSRHLYHSHTLPTRPVYINPPHTVPASSFTTSRRRSSLDFTWSAAFASLAQSSSDFDTASAMPEYTYLPQTIMSERRRSELFFPPATTPPPATGDPMLDAFPYLAIGNPANFDTGGISVMGMVPEYFLAQQYQDSVFNSHRSEPLSQPRQCPTSPLSSASTTSVSPLDLPQFPVEPAAHSSSLGAKWANFTMAQGYTTSTHSQLSSSAKTTPVVGDISTQADYPPAPPSAPILGEHSAIELNIPDLGRTQLYSTVMSRSSRRGAAGGAGSCSALPASRLPPKSSFRITRPASTDATHGSSTRRYESEESASPLTTTSQSSNSMSEEEEAEDEDDDEDDGDDDEEYTEPVSRRSCGIPRRRSARQFVDPDISHSLQTMPYHGDFVDPGALHEFLPTLALPSGHNTQWSAQQYSEEEGIDDDDSQEADEDDDESMEDKMARSKKGVYRCNHCPEKFNTMEQFYNHIEAEGVDRPFKCSETSCPWSRVGFPNRNECNRHIKHQHAGSMYSCSYSWCPKKFPRKDSRNRHEKLVHEKPDSRLNRKLEKKRMEDEAKARRLAEGNSPAGVARFKSMLKKKKSISRLANR